VCGAETKAAESLQEVVKNVVEQASVTGAVAAPVESGFVTQNVAPQPVAYQEEAYTNEEYVYEDYADETYEGQPQKATRGEKKQRNFLLPVTILAMLTAITTITIFVVTRQGEEYTPAPPGIYGAQTQAPSNPQPTDGLSLYHIERVVYGHLANYPNTTVGTAFGQFFTDYMWTHLLRGDTDYVNFFGMMAQHNAEPISVQIMFRFDPDNTSFSPSRLLIGGIQQDTVAINGLLDSVFGV